MTTEEKENQALLNTQDDYLEDDFNVYYRKNIKKDPGSLRLKIIPDWKINLETPVPDEPQEKHDIPNDNHYKKEIEKIDNKIKEHNTNREALRKQKQSEISGEKPENKSIFDEINELKGKIESLDKQITEKREKNKELLEKETKLKTIKLKYEKEVEIKNVEKLQQTIRYYQEQLGFATLSAQDEKKIMQHKSKLEGQLEGTKKYCKARDDLKALRDGNKSSFEEVKVLIEEKKKLNDKRKALYEKVDEIKKSRKDNNEVINQIKAQIVSISTAIKELYDEKNKLQYEWDEKWYKYEEYKKVIDYINNIKKIQNDIRKREEKQKKKEEKELKKNIKVENIEINIQKSTETIESASTKNLIDFFKGLLPKQQQSSTVVDDKSKNVLSDKISQDLKKGVLVQLDRETLNSKDVISIATNKKKKEPKIKNKEEKESPYLLLDVVILSQIRELKLTPPNKKTEIEAFVKILEGKLIELKAAELQAKDQSKVEN